jgi:hypothetical protein
MYTITMLPQIIRMKNKIYHSSQSNQKIIQSIDKIDTCNKLVEQKLLTLLEHHLYISKLNLPTQNEKNIISF